MRIRAASRIVLTVLLGTFGLAVKADGSPAKDTPSMAKMVPIQLGQVDAVSGDLSLRFPVGPRLPGRIPLGFTFTFDTQDSVLSQIGASLKPVVWPGGSGSPQITTVWVDGQPWVFQKHASPKAGLPSNDQIHQWMLQRHVDDGQAEATAANDSSTGITPSFNAVEVLPSADGTRFYIRTNWTVGKWVIDKVTQARLACPVQVAGRTVILSGADAIWTGAYLAASTTPAPATHFTNRWGDHVSVTESGGKQGAPTSIKILNENSPSEWVQWVRSDAAQTITITSSPTIPLPSVVLKGTITDLERKTNQWSTYPTGYDPNYTSTGIYDSGIIPTSIVTTAGNESQTIAMTWFMQPAHDVVNPWVSSTKVTVPNAWSVTTITEPSGLSEHFAYVKVGNLSTDSFNPLLDAQARQPSSNTWTGYNAWSDNEWPYVTTNAQYDPVNPAGAGLGVSRIITTIPANNAAPVLTSVLPTDGGASARGNGFTIIIARKQPSAHGTNGTTSEAMYLSTFLWDQRDHTTTILRYASTSPQVGDAYRGVILTHPSATGPCQGWGSSISAVQDQHAAYLFATSAIFKEEAIHGSGVSPQANHPDDWEPNSPVVDKTILYDEWNLSCWANPTGSLVNGLPVVPHALRTASYSSTAPGAVSWQAGMDDYGPTESDVNYRASLAAPPAVTGTSTASWSNTNNNGDNNSPIFGGTQSDCSLTRKASTSRHWDASLMTLLTDSTVSQLSGTDLAALRSGSASPIDFGTTSYTYDPKGRVTSISGSRGASVATEAFSYQDNQPLILDSTKTLTLGSNPVALSGQIGKTYTYDTSPYHWLQSETDKIDGRPTVFLQRDSMGRPQKIKGPDGVVNDIVYDDWGRLQTKTREAKGAAGAFTTSYTYDPNGAWSEVTESYTDADGQVVQRTTHTDFDAAGRPVKVTSPDGSYQITQYDGWGQMVLQSPLLKPGQTAYGNSQWVYDAKGRVTATYDPKGRRLSYQPNDPAWSGTDDIAGRLVSTVFTPGPGSTKPGDPELPRTVKTDILGQQREVIDQAGQTSSYAYDWGGRLASTTQGSQVRSYAYNDLGWLISRTEPEEGTTTFGGFAITGVPTLTTQLGISLQSSLKTQISLNAWGLPSEIQVWNGNSLSTDRVLTYNTSTHLLTNLWESQSNGTLMETYGYDDLYRLTSKTVSDGGGQSFTVSRVLDAGGQVSTLNYPSAAGQSSVVKYGYDALGRPRSVKLNGATRATGNPDYAVSGTSVSSQVLYGNGASTVTRVNAGEVAEVQQVYSGGSQDNLLQWSTGGLLLFRGPDASSSAPQQSDAFQYDALQRLTSAVTYSWDDPAPANWDKLTQIFQYDRWGNRASQKWTWASPKGHAKPDEVLAWDATAIASNNQLPQNVTTSSGSLSTGAVYDNLGRLTNVWAIPGNSASLTTWTYDATGRVVAENGATFLLDSAGLRFKRNQTDKSIQYTVYGFNGEPLSVFRQASSTTSGQAVAMMVPIGGGGGGDVPPPDAGAFITQPSGPITVGVGVSTAFTGTSTHGTSFSWTFGDGGTGTGATTTHIFSSPGTYNVTLTASAVGYSDSTVSVAITVVPAPSVTGFTVTPSTITLGDSALLSWTTANATSLSLDQGIGTVTGLTSKSITPGKSGAISYHLTATSAVGSATASVFLYVAPSPAPVINGFTASPSAVPAGQPLTLKWNVTQARTLSVAGVGTVTGKSCTVYPTATRSYTLSASNGAGTVTASVAVQVIGAPVINRFAATPTGISTGQSTMLAWDVTGAASLTLAGGGNTWTVTGNSYQIVQPSASTVYTLTATNNAGGVTRQAAVTVSAPGALAWVRSMVYGFGQLISEERADVGTTYIQGDQVGSPSLITDSGGHLVGRTKGLPFGERAWQWGAQSARRYTNHEDQPGSSVYMQARMYLPAYGRFAQPDPAYDQTKLDPESWNLYSYVTNNPVTHTDPDGRMAAQVGENYGKSVIAWQNYNDGFDESLLDVSHDKNNKLNININLGLEPVMLSEIMYLPGGNLGDGFKSYNIFINNIENSLLFSYYSAQTDQSISIHHYSDGKWTDATSITSDNRFINGMMNTLKMAEDISVVEMGKMKISEFDLVHIPSKGFLGDIGRALADKLGFTTQTAKELAGIISSSGPGHWYAHSYGGVAFTEAVRTIARGGGTLTGQSVTFLAGANNRWVTNGIMRGAGVTVGGYHGSWFDLVPNVTGMNSLNPIQWAVDILASPLLFTRWSPHTHPPVD